MKHEIIEITLENALFDAVSEYAEQMGITLYLAIENLLALAVVDLAADMGEN